MANWQYTLDIEKTWKKSKNKEVALSVLSNEIADKMEALRPSLAIKFKEDSGILSELDDIVFDLRDLAGSEDKDDVDIFDEIFSRVYDWADTEILPKQWPPKKLCWVKTDF